MLTVSLCVVALNEEKYIPNLLLDLINQDYPHELTEMIFIDGGSIDGTFKILSNFCSSTKGYMSLRVLNNPKRIQSAGWNIALKEFKNDVIIRIDAHTHIPCDFTKKNIINLESGEFISGGIRPCISENHNWWGNLLLQTENSLFGSSINKARHSNEKQYVKTMFHAAYKREVFQSSGGFNENLLRTEDNEIHYRIRCHGYRLLFDPNIVSYQYSRNTLKRMIKQKYANGYLIGLTLGVSPKCLSIYHFVPFGFLLAIIVTTILSFFSFFFPLLILFCVYFLFCIVAIVIACINEKFRISYFLMPFLFFILHISYGLGTSIGLLKMPFLAKKLKSCSDIHYIKMNF